MTLRILKRKQRKPTGRERFNGIGDLAASALAIGWLAVNVFDGCKAVKNDISKDSEDSEMPDLSKDKFKDKSKDKSEETEGSSEKSDKSDKSDKEEESASEEETEKDASEEETASEETAPPKKKTKSKKA